MDSTHVDATDSRPSTPSSFGSLLGSSLASLPSNFRHPHHLSRASSFSGDSSYQWSPVLPQNSYGQTDSYPGSPLVPSGSLIQPHERFRSTSSSLSHNDRQLEELRTHCDHLTHRNTALEAEVVTIKYAYEALINRVPALISSPLGGISTPVFPLVSSPLREEDFPEVSFWTREKWTTREKADNSISNGEKMGERGGSKMAKGINISMQYVEDKHGVLIDGFRVKMILGAAHQLFFQLREVKRHPKTWGAAGTQTLRAYCQEMEKQFPELALCADSWKSKYIATQNYSSWYNSHGKVTVKVEVSDDDMDQPTKKRRSSHEDRKSSKKKKSSDSQPKQDLRSHSPTQPAISVTPLSPASPPAILSSPVLNFNPLFGVSISSVATTIATTPGSSHIITTALAAKPPMMVPTLLPSTASPDTSPIAQPLPLPGITALPTADEQLQIASSPVNASLLLPLIPSPQSTEPSMPASVSTLASTTYLTDNDLTTPGIQTAPTIPAVPITSNASVALNVTPLDKALSKIVKYVPSKTSTTSRNLCGRDWCTENPGGTTAAYSLYWQQIKDTTEEKKYIELSDAAKGAKRMAAAGVDVPLP